MKKTLLFSLLLVFSSLLSFAQDVTEKMNNGITSLSCKGLDLDYPTLSYTTFGCIINPNADYYYNLAIAIRKDKMQIKKGKKLLINFEDGSVIKLSSMRDAETRKYAEGNACIPGYTKITESEMEQLVSKKITKLSVEHKSGTFDIDITDDELSNAWKQIYGALKEAKRAHDVSDETNSEGKRSLIHYPIFLDYPNINGISLGYFMNPDGVNIYNLMLNINKENIKISAGKKLLIKLGDGSVLEYITANPKKQKNIVIAYGNIPESEMNEILSKKITKIRVEHDSGYLDQDITDDVLSKKLGNMYDEIQEVLNTPKKDVYSDF